MDRGNRAKNNQKTDAMMLDSGTTSHLIRIEDIGQLKTSCDVSFKIAEDSKKNATNNGKRDFTLLGDDGTRSVSLWDTIVLPNSAIRMIYVSALVKKYVGVPFITEYPILFDLLDSNIVLGFAQQRTDGLLYIREDGSTSEPKHT